MRRLYFRSCQGYANSLSELKGKHVGLPIVNNAYENALLFSLFESDENNRLKDFSWILPEMWLGITVEEVTTRDDPTSGHAYYFKNWDETHVIYTHWGQDQPNYSIIQEKHEKVSLYM